MFKRRVTGVIFNLTRHSAGSWKSSSVTRQRLDGGINGITDLRTCLAGHPHDQAQ